MTKPRFIKHPPLKTDPKYLGAKDKIKRGTLTKTKVMEHLKARGYDVTREVNINGDGNSDAYTINAHESDSFELKKKITDFAINVSSCESNDELISPSAFHSYNSLLELAPLPDNEPPGISSTITELVNGVEGMQAILKNNVITISHKDTPELYFQPALSDTEDNIKNRLKRYKKAQEKYLGIKKELGDAFSAFNPIINPDPKQNVFEGVVAAAIKFEKEYNRRKPKAPPTDEPPAMPQDKDLNLPPANPAEMSVEDIIKKEGLTKERVLQNLHAHGYPVTRDISLTPGNFGVTPIINKHESDKIPLQLVTNYTDSNVRFLDDENLITPEGYGHYKKLIAAAEELGYPLGRTITEVPAKIVDAVKEHEDMHAFIQNNQIRISHKDTPELWLKVSLADKASETQQDIKTYKSAQRKYLKLKEELGDRFNQDLYKDQPFDKVVTAAVQARKAAGLKKKPSMPPVEKPKAPVEEVVVAPQEAAATAASPTLPELEKPAAAPPVTTIIEPVKAAAEKPPEIIAPVIPIVAAVAAASPIPATAWASRTQEPTSDLAKEARRRAASITAKAHPKPQQIMTAPPVTAASVNPAKPAQKPLDQKHVTLVLDASILANLRASRDDKKNTWLDLIHETSRLPNVSIVIPAYIADWELRGGISNIINGEPRFKNIDLHFRKGGKHSEKALAVQKLLENATRATRKPNGQIAIMPPRGNISSNIIIWETQKCREAFDDIQEIDRTELNTSTKWQKISSKYRQTSLGEECIEQFINDEIPFASPVIVLTEDMPYKNGRKYNMSYMGEPVGTARLKDYVTAEMDARGDFLTKKMNRPELSPNMIEDELSAYAKKTDKTPNLSRGPRFHKNEEIGQYTNHTTAESLAEVITRGVALAQAGLPTYSPKERLLEASVEITKKTPPASNVPTSNTPAPAAEENTQLGYVMIDLMAISGITRGMLAEQINILSKSTEAKIPYVTAEDVKHILSGRHAPTDDNFYCIADALIWKNPKIQDGQRHPLYKKLQAAYSARCKEQSPASRDTYHELGELVWRMMEEVGLTSPEKMADRLNASADNLRSNHHTFTGDEIFNIIAGKQHPNSIFVHKFLTVVERAKKDTGKPPLTDDEKYALFQALDNDLAKGHLYANGYNKGRGNGNGLYTS